MQVTETFSEGLKRAYTVVLPGTELEDKRSAKLSEIGRTLNLPGFRPGRVPASLVRKRYGGAVMADVLSESVDEATKRVMSERGLRPAGQPKVDLLGDPSKAIVPDAGAQPADIEFKVELELLPDITVPDFGSLALTRYKAMPSDEVVETSLGEIAHRLREQEAVTDDRPAQTGDVATVDFVGKVGDEAFEGGTGNDIKVEIGGQGFIPGFAEQIAGMRVGESRTIEVTFPEDYAAKELAGKAANFGITLKALAGQIVPPVDEALATKIGFDNLGEMRDTVRGRLQGEYDRVSRLRLKRDLLDLLEKSALFEAPEGLTQSEFEAIWRRVEADMKAGKLDADDVGKDEATLRAEYRVIAERRVRLGLLLAEIGRSNSITVTAEEMMAAMRAEAQRYPGQEREVLEFFRKNPQAAEGLRGPIFEDKVVGYVIDAASVTERVVAAEELRAEPEATPAAAPPRVTEPSPEAVSEPAGELGSEPPAV